MGILSDAFQVTDPPTELVRDTFIETGSGIGASFAVALEKPYRRLYTIEWDYESHTKCLRRLEHQLHLKCPCGCGFERVATLLHGSSPELLPRILKPDADTTFFLDAHFVSEDSQMDPRFGQCPLIRELEIIASVPWKRRPAILIDDARMLDGDCKRDAVVDQRFDWKQWPDLNDIMRTVAQHRFSMSILNEQIWLY